MAYLGQLQETGPVVAPRQRRNIFKQNPNQMAIGTAQDYQNASGVVQAGAVGRDNPIIAQSQQMAKKYAPMLMGQQPKTNEQVINERNVRQTGGFKAAPIGNNGNSSTAGMDYLNSLYTSPEEEERLRKASVMNQRILAVGDALRHIGNIANTVNYAPAQQFNSPVQEEYNRYQQGKALRDRANQQFYTYQQAKAAQDAAQRKWEQQFGLQQANYASQHAYRQEQARIAAERAANQKAYQEGTLTLRGKLGEAQQKERERHNRVAEQQGRQRIGIASQNAKNMQNYRQWKMKGGGGSGSSIAPLDTPKGQITPSGRNYNNQLQQIWNYAETKGLVKQSDVQRALAQAGIGNETPESVKRQQVMSLLRTNQSLADYAQQRLGWTYGASNPSTDWDEFAEEEENWDAFAED